MLGANWCHDSRALAGWIETPRFAALVAEHYELVFVNVGMPQTGEGRNLEIARRFGLDELKGTPALVVLAADGRAINLDTAASWRNAASRIDIADLRIFRRPLRKSQRLRNFKHMLRYPQDRQWLLDAGDSSFVDGYLAAQQLCSREELTRVLA